MAIGKRTKIAMLIAAAAAIGLAVAALGFPDSIRNWLAQSNAAGTLTISGNIEAHESVLSFKTIQSRIVELPFDEGKWVTAGTVVARVDDADYRQQALISESALEVQRRQQATAEQNLLATQKTLMSDEADLAQKRIDLERNEALWQRGFVSSVVRDQSATALKQTTAVLERDRALKGAAEKNVDLAKASIHNAEEALQLARMTLDYTTLRAPFDGVILVRQAELGEVVAPGTPIVTLADLNHVWLRAYVNETDIGKVRHGQGVLVTTDTYPGKKYRGRISFISSNAEFTPKSVETHAERVMLVYRVRIDIDNPTHELVPGMPADARIELLPPGS